MTGLFSTLDILIMAKLPVVIVVLPLFNMGLGAIFTFFEPLIENNASFWKSLSFPLNFSCF